MADDMSMNPSRDDFSALLEESLGGRDFMEGQVVKGLVVAIEKDIAIIDVGLKTEGRVSLKEFGEEEGRAPIKVGDTVEVRENVYMLVGAGGNTTIHVGTDGIMVVDTQFAPLSTKIINAIRAATGNSHSGRSMR